MDGRGPRLGRHVLLGGRKRLLDVGEPEVPVFPRRFRRPVAAGRRLVDGQVGDDPRLERLEVFDGFAVLMKRF